MCKERIRAKVPRWTFILNIANGKNWCHLWLLGIQITKKGSFTHPGRCRIIFTCSKILQFRLRKTFVFRFIFLVKKKVKGSSASFSFKITGLWRWKPDPYLGNLFPTTDFNYHSNIFAVQEFLENMTLTTEIFKWEDMDCLLGLLMFVSDVIER